MTDYMCQYSKVTGSDDLHLVNVTQASKADIVRALLSNGADPGVQNSEGKLPLDLANDQIKWVYNEELLQSTAQSK